MQGDQMINKATLDHIQDRVAIAVQVDLEHGVAWMNDEASKEFDDTYPEIAKVLGWIAELDEIESPSQ